MKVDVKIAGASYSEVPAVLLPLKNGSRARFCEVSDTTAEASDVALSKRFYTSEGKLVVGTAELSQGADTRKKITLIQKEHRTLRFPAITRICPHRRIWREIPSMLQNTRMPWTSA